MPNTERPATFVQRVSRRSPAVSVLVTNTQKVIGRVLRGDHGVEQSAASSRYCYSVWLRHLVIARQNGLPTDPMVVAELGPGFSIGVGLAALLTGADKYFGLDQTAYANLSANGPILDSLVELLKRRAPIPDDDEFPEVRPRLPSYQFPTDILPDDRLERALRPERIEAIRSILEGRSGGDPVLEIRYFAPWDSPDVVSRCTGRQLQHLATGGIMANVPSSVVGSHGEIPASLSCKQRSRATIHAKHA